jgi:alpha-L-fucosidase
VRTTAKGRDVFIHVFDWPAAALELTAENLPKFRSASLLATGQSLEFHQEGRRLTLKLPARAPDPDVSVIAMRAAV